MPTNPVTAPGAVDNPDAKPGFMPSFPGLSSVPGWVKWGALILVGYLIYRKVRHK